MSAPDTALSLLRELVDAFPQCLNCSTPSCVAADAVRRAIAFLAAQDTSTQKQESER